MVVPNCYPKYHLPISKECIFVTQRLHRKLQHLARRGQASHQSKLERFNRAKFEYIQFYLDNNFLFTDASQYF